MPPQRTADKQLVRLFSAAVRPIYLVDERHEIVYCNPACAAWAGVSADELIGQTCVYGAPAENPAPSAAAAAAARLSPPPGARADAGGRGHVSAIDQRGTLVFRQAEFVSLIATGSAADLSGDRQPSAEAVLLEAASVAALPSGLLVLVGGENLPAPADGDTPADPSIDTLHAELAHWRHRLANRFRSDRLVGTSSAAARVRAQVALAAAAPANVLIVGPAGSGKEHVAKAIHYAPPAEASGALVPVACAALDTELLISTLRSLDRSTPGATRWRTVLLSSVDALSLDAQAALMPLVASLASWRVIATAARGPVELVAAGLLRADLAAWLGTLVIELPPLAERTEDLPLLAQMFLEELNATAARQLAGFTPEALDQLAAYPWPGNLDELADVVAEAHEQAADALVGPRDLPRRIFLAVDAAQRPPRRDEPIDLEQFLAKIETELIQRALARAKGNKSRAAKLLHLTRPRLYRRMVQLGLAEDRPDFRPSGDA